MPPAPKYKAISGTASAAMESGSAVGEKAATKKVMAKMAKRHGFRIDFPDKTNITIKNFLLVIVAQLNDFVSQTEANSKALDLRNLARRV